MGRLPAQPGPEGGPAPGLEGQPHPAVSRLHSLIAGEEVVRARSGFLPTVKSEVSQTIYDNEIQAKIPAGSHSRLAARGRPLLSHHQPEFLEQQDLPGPDDLRLLGHPSRYQAAVLGKSASLLDTAKTRDDIFLTVSQGYFAPCGPRSWRSWPNRRSPISRPI